MRRIGPAMLAAAALLCAAPGWAQSEMEIYQQTGDGLLAAHREALQLNIDRASSALKAKDYVNARKYAQSVTRADPKRVEAWLMLGAAQTGLEDWKGARRTYATAQRLSPSHPEVRGGLGVAQARMGDPRAQEQVAWLAARVQTCGDCWQSAQLVGLKGAVEAAVAQAAKGP